MMREQVNQNETAPFRQQAKALWMRTRVLWGIIAGIFLILVTLATYNYLYPPPTPLTEDQIHQLALNAMGTATPPAPYAAQVYQFILPSLVIIQTEGNDPESADGNFGIGSGVVINEDGNVLTSLHVVTNTQKIEIHFADGTRTTAQIAGTDPANDIALLQPDQLPELIVPAILGNPNSMNVGDDVYAVGNPLGLAGSISAGIISAFDRSVPLPNSEARLDGLIQFDAAVNPGNSGGPLLNRNGQVIGIVTALVNPANQDFFTGISFAVPIDTAASAAGAPPY